MVHHQKLEDVAGFSIAVVQLVAPDPFPVFLAGRPNPLEYDWRECQSVTGSTVH